MLTIGQAMTGVEPQAQVTVHALGPALRRIELRGRLPVGWAGRLAAGLAAQRIGIVRAWGSERSGGAWEAGLDVELPRYTLELTPASVRQLAGPDAAPVRSALDGLELLEFRLVTSGEDVRVELEAADARGFLDRVLRLFALHGLFPRELKVETTDGLVHDVFRLRGAHGGAPEPATIAALEAMLRRVRVP